MDVLNIIFSWLISTLVEFNLGLLERGDFFVSNLVVTQIRGNFIDKAIQRDNPRFLQVYLLSSNLLSSNQLPYALLSSNPTFVQPYFVIFWTFFASVEVNDRQTPPPFILVTLRLLLIRILHLRKRREKSFPMIKMFLVFIL